MQVQPAALQQRSKEAKKYADKMKTYILLCCLVVSASAAYLPRQRRDVSELLAPEAPAYNYLPPEPKLALPEAEITVEVDTQPAAPAAASAALGANGYEYRTVRRLKFRTQRRRRDVSHLTSHYLPPQNDYLPPAAAAAGAAGAPAAATAIAPTPSPTVAVDESDTEEVVAAAVPKVANEYLPPATKVISTAAPIAPIVVETEAPVAVVRDVEAEVVDAPAAEHELQQDTAVLADDGYHYKQPEQVPELKTAPVTEANAVEYLPPVDDDSVVVEGPEMSAVLADDGYHYRTIRRLRF